MQRKSTVILKQEPMIVKKYAKNIVDNINKALEIIDSFLSDIPSLLTEKDVKLLKPYTRDLEKAYNKLSNIVEKLKAKENIEAAEIKKQASSDYEQNIWNAIKMLKEEGWKKDEAYLYISSLWNNPITDLIVKAIYEPNKLTKEQVLRFKNRLEDINTKLRQTEQQKENIKEQHYPKEISSLINKTIAELKKRRNDSSRMAQ